MRCMECTRCRGCFCYVCIGFLGGFSLYPFHPFCAQMPRGVCFLCMCVRVAGWFFLVCICVCVCFFSLFLLMGRSTRVWHPPRIDRVRLPPSHSCSRTQYTPHACSNPSFYIHLLLSCCVWILAIMDGWLFSLFILQQQHQQRLCA